MTHAAHARADLLPPPPLPVRAHGARSGVASVTTLADARNRRPAPRPLQLDGDQPPLPFPDGDPRDPRPRSALRLVTGPDDDTEQVAARLAQLLIEVLAGDRAVHQLMRWTNGETYRDLLRRADALQRLTPPRRPGARRIRLILRSVHVSTPYDGVAEVAVHIRHGGRSRAIAARLEFEEDRWRCTALEFD